MIELRKDKKLLAVSYIINIEHSLLIFNDFDI